MFSHPNVIYDNNKGAWIVLNNSPALAQEVKNMYPDEPVFLFDIKTGNYEPYLIEYKRFRPEMKNGKFINEPETCQIQYVDFDGSRRLAYFKSVE